MTEVRKCCCVVSLIAVLLITFNVAVGQETDVDAATSTFDELKLAGAHQSSYQKQQYHTVATETPEPQLAVFRKEIQPMLSNACVQCHGPETQEGHIRIDTLDPDLLHGHDVNWWLEVVAVLSNGEILRRTRLN